MFDTRVNTPEFGTRDRVEAHDPMDRPLKETLIGINRKLIEAEGLYGRAIADIMGGVGYDALDTKEPDSMQEQVFQIDVRAEKLIGLANRLIELLFGRG